MLSDRLDAVAAEQNERALNAMQAYLIGRSDFDPRERFDESDVDAAFHAQGSEQKIVVAAARLYRVGSSTKDGCDTRHRFGGEQSG